MLTNQTLICLSRNSAIRVLGLENCPLLDNNGIRYLVDIAEKLEVVNFAGIYQLTDLGVAPLFKACHSLVVVTLSNCPHLTHEAMHLLALNNRRLTTLHASATQISDAGLSLICSAFSKKSMTSLDVSLCRDITDHAIISIGQSAPGIKFLNLAGLSRITDEGARALCANLWYLESLNLEDVFLLDDLAFSYERNYDGRPAAEENMLKFLVTLNLRDCVNVTEKGIRGLSERCRKIETLILRGCDKVTDTAILHLTNPFDQNFPMADALRVLDLAFCSAITAQGILRVLPFCGVLEELRLSGCTSVDDAFIKQMCLKCPTITRLVLDKCVFLTDVTMCYLADYLWLETLDIAGCHRITDDGIEVLSVACNGILKILARRVNKLTGKAINSISRNCRGIQVLDIRECPLVSAKSIADLLINWPYITLIK